MELPLSFSIILLTLGAGAFAFPGNGSRVYGGYQIAIKDAPWMAHINYYFTENNTNWVSGCGGSIFNEWYILTAAHCATKEKSGQLRTNNASQYEIRVGSSHKNKGGSVYRVAKVTPHPSYDPAGKAHDVALLQLTEKIVYNQKTVQNVRLDTGEYKAGTKVSSMGWGDNPKNPGTPYLFIVDLNIVDIDKCARDHRESPAEYRQHKICAIGPKKADVCKGDSGGPLMVGHNNQQIGLVSYGANCPQPGWTTPSAGVYAKIADNIGWINSVTSGSKGEDEEDDDRCPYEPAVNKPKVEEVGVVSDEDD